jgi:tripartite-type tricarboxylate transporter receptor subunit TctC
MKSIFLSTALILSSASLILTAPKSAIADDYPTQPIRIVIPYGPGGAVDTTLRILSEGLQEELGQPIVIDSRPGGLGIIAINEVAQAEPDGYTVLAGNQSSNLISALFHADRMTVDYFEDFRPVARIVEFPGVVMLTTNNFEPRTFDELLDHAKQNPGAVRYTSTGVGSFPHFDVEMIAAKEDLDMLHVPVTSGAAGIGQAIVNGDVHLAINNIATSLPFIEAGQATAVAVVFPERLDALPDVPTLEELGYGGIGTVQWVSMFAPAGVDESRLEKLATAIAKVMDRDDVRATFQERMIAPNPTRSLDEAEAWFSEDVQRWREIIEVTGIEIE